jgi:hypothetical protein
VVECDLAKVEVAGSNPVSRSNVFSAIKSLIISRILFISKTLRGSKKKVSRLPGEGCCQLG